MTEKNWPEPYAHEFGKSAGGGYYTVDMERGKPKQPVPDWPVTPLYTATQVREIVKHEVEGARSLMQALVLALGDTLEDSVSLLNDLLPHAGWERYDRQIAHQRATIEKANEALDAARNWLKENNHAD